MTNFSEILHNENFNRLAIVINIPFHSEEWRRDNAKIPFWTLWKAFDKASPLEGSINKETVISTLTDLITRIVESDPNFLFYEIADLDWFFEMLDGANAEVMVSMFKAWVSATHSFVTPQQIAEATDTNASNWRNRAAGQSGYQPIPGCRKVGTTWLIPLVLLQSQGIMPWDYKVQTE